MNIEKTGFKIYPKNLFKLNNNILYEFKEILKKKTFKSNGHQNTSIIENINHIENYQETKKIFEQIIKILKKKKYYNKLVFDDIWFINSTTQTYKPKKLPFIPHIDKIRKFKIMIYLNNVKKENGPLNLAKANPKNYEVFRKNLKFDYKKKQENEVTNLSSSKYKSLTGKFGTVIFFDTNTPHFAGKITNSSKRKVIRFNFRFIEKNKKSLFIKILKKLI